MIVLRLTLYAIMVVLVVNIFIDILDWWWRR